MKLRNLLFGTMIACAFAACSNEDDPIPSVDPTPETGTASLTVSVKNMSKMETKAGETDTNAKDGEANISTLTVVLYDATTGAYVDSKTVSDNSVTEDANASNDEVKFEGLAAGQTLKAFAVANITTSFEETTSATMTLTSTISEFAANELPMSSGLSDEFTLAVGDNYYGYAATTAPDANHIADEQPLGLIRNVARVHLSKVVFDLSKAKEPYINGTTTFKPQSVFIKHGRTISKIADLTMAANKATATWGDVAATYEENSTAFFSGKKESGTKGEVYGAYMKSLTGDEYDGAVTGSKTYDYSNSDLYFYVFENRNTTAQAKLESYTNDELATELVISGEFSLTKAQKEEGGPTFSIQKQTSYWPIVIGVDGIENNFSADGIHRNVIYQIEATLAGRGLKDSTTPDGEEFSDLFVKTEVVAWGTASQKPVIE